MTTELLILLIAMIVFIIVFLYVEPILSKHKVKNDSEYGSARFSTINEIKKTFRKERIKSIKKSGFPIYYDKELNHVWFDNETPHYVYLGSTGSGKSVTAVIPTCSFIATAKEKRSVFITDPKGEIFHTTSQMFKNNGYNVITIDFRNPELSNKFNILEPIIKEYEDYINYEKLSKGTTDKEEQIKYNNLSMSSYAETNRLITSLATMVTQEKVQQKDPFWNNSARSLLEGLIGFFLEEYKSKKIKKEQITMTSIRKFQNSTMEERNQKKFKDYIEIKEYGLKSKDSLTSILSASDNTYKSITAVFGEKMALFDDINVANVTSKSDFEFDLLGRKATALFVIVPDEDKIYYSLVTIIVGLLYRSLVKLANNSKDKKLPVQIDFLLDEFANCPPLSDIEAIVSVARSRGMRFQFFIQSLSQLDNVYGKEVAQIILDNCGLVYLKTNTEETAEAISKRLGKKTIESSSISQSVSLLNYNGNKSTSLIGRDLLTPEEVKQLHYKTIIFPIIGHPIFRDTVVYQKIKCYQEGELHRIPVSLLNLKDTYFTVEQIKMEKRKSNTQSNDLEKDQQEFYCEQKKFEIESFKSVEEIFKKIFEDRKYEILYEEENNRTYASISIDKSLNNREKSLIDNEINKDMYQVNIDLGNNGQGVIEIHLKSPLEIALGDNK